MKLKDLDKVDAWGVGGTILGPGWHEVDIDSVDTSKKSRGGHDQWIIGMSNAEGQITDWQVVIESTMGKVKQILEAARIPIQSGEFDFEPQVLVGKKVKIKVATEPNLNDPSKLRTVIVGYVPPGSDQDLAEANVADDIPF